MKATQSITPPLSQHKLVDERGPDPLPSLMERIPDIRLQIGYEGVLCAPTT